MKEEPIPHEISWFFAFKTLLRGLGSKGMAGVKAGILFCALAGPVVAGLAFWQRMEVLSGDLPPLVPIIEVDGVFERKIRKEGLRETGYIELATESGARYLIKGSASYSGLERLSQRKPALKVAVKGFFLQNGKGNFFPVQVKSGDLFMLTEEEALKNLKRRRDPAEPLGLVYCLAVLWLLSLINVYKLKKKLSAGESEDGSVVT